MIKRKIKKYVVKVSEGNFLARLSYSKAEESLLEKNGFKDHEDAMQWLFEELEIINPSYKNWSFFQLTQMIEKDSKNKRVKQKFKYKVEKLMDDMLINMVFKEGISEERGIIEIDRLFGHSWNEIFFKAKNNTLDALVSLEEEKENERAIEKSQHISDSKWKASEKANTVLEIIKAIPGKKEVIAHFDYDYDLEIQIDIFHIEENGSFEYEKENEFLKKVDCAFVHNNFFTVCQLIPNSEQEIIKNGEPIKVPWTAFSAFTLKDGNMYCSPAEDVEAYFTDEEDQLNKQDELIIYKDFVDFLTGYI